MTSAMQPSELRERRFSASFEPIPKPVFALAALSAAAVGAGFYDKFLTGVQHDEGIWLILLGLFGVGAAAWRLGLGAPDLLLGDAGIAVDRADEVERIPWFELKSVTRSGDSLHLVGDSRRITLPITAHRVGVAQLLSELRSRPITLTERLPELSGPIPDCPVLLAQPVRGLQITGRRCAASHLPIRLERDARLCPRCAQLYLVGELPVNCTTCQTPLRQEPAAT